MIAVWCVANTVERVCTCDRSTAVHSSIETHRAWVDGVIQVVENGRGHLRQEHDLRYVGIKRSMGITSTNEASMRITDHGNRSRTTAGKTTTRSHRLGQAYHPNYCKCRAFTPFLRDTWYMLSFWSRVSMSPCQHVNEFSYIRSRYHLFRHTCTSAYLFVRGSYVFRDLKAPANNGKQQ